MAAKIALLAGVSTLVVGLGAFAFVQVNAQQATRPPNIISPPLGPAPSPAPITAGPAMTQGSLRVVFQPIHAIASSGMAVSANGAFIAIADDDMSPGLTSPPAAPTAAQPGMPPSSVPTLFPSPGPTSAPPGVPTVRLSPVPPTANPPPTTPPGLLPPAAPTNAPRLATIKTLDVKTGAVLGTTKARPEQMAWSPDGNWLAIVERTTPVLVDGRLVSYATVVRLNRNLQQREVIIAESHRVTSVVSLAWLPDSATLLINGRLSGNEGVLLAWSNSRNQLTTAYRIDLGLSSAPSSGPGTPPQPPQPFLSISSAFLGQIDPVSNRILLQISARRSGESQPYSRLISLNISTGETETIWEDSGVFVDGRLSPDGRKIAFLRPGGVGLPPEAWISNRDGTAAEKLADPGSRIMCWSGDSRNVVIHHNGFTPAPRNNTAIVVRNIDTKQDSLIASAAETEAIVSAWCSPESRDVLFAKGNHGNWQVISTGYE